MKPSTLRLRIGEAVLYSVKSVVATLAAGGTFADTISSAGDSFPRIFIGETEIL